MSLRWRLYQIPLLIALVLLAVGSLWQFYHWVLDTELNKLQQQVESSIRRYSVTLSNEIDKFQSLPHLLATNPDLEWLLLAPQNEQRIEQLNDYFEQVAEITRASDIYLMDATGTTIAASNWQQPNTFIGRNFHYRPYFQQAIEGEAGRYFALGTTSRKRGYYFSYPVRSDTKITGVVVVKIDLNDIEEQWSDPILDLLVTDSDGIIFISTRPDWKFRSLNPLSETDLARIQQSRRYPDQLLSSIPIHHRQQLNSNTLLVSLVGEQHQPELTDEYLLMKQPMPKADLHVVGLAKLTEVKAQLLTSLVLAGVFLVVLVLLISFVRQRRRISLERTRFKQQSTEALAANEARIRAILDNTQAGLITLDEQGQIETINPTAERMLGYATDQLIGSRFIELICESAHSRLTQFNTKTNTLFLETLAYRQDGSSFPMEISVSELDFRGQHKRLITLHDITERKEYEEDLRQARDQLEARVAARTNDLSQANQRLKNEIEQHQHTQNELIQAAKLAVLGQLSAGINHELNQPLTAIRAYADNTRQFVARGQLETAEANLNEISSLVNHMSKIIAPLKVFSRKSSGQAEPVSLQAIRDGAMSILYGRLDQATVNVVWPKELANTYVMGDMVRLEQVVVNLLSNAMEAMEGQANKTIDISLEQSPGWVTLQVRDHGPGIDETSLSRVFEPFFTTKGVTQGLGLGLSISQRIIESLGGELQAQNHPAGGAVFSMKLKSAS